MMEWIKKNKILICIAVVLLGISIFLLYYSNKNDEFSYEEDNISLKHYEENEYIPVSISIDEMARIYLQDYVYKLMYNREDAYNTLNEEYRKAKFKSFEDFNNYVDNIMSLKMQEMVVNKYAISDKGDYRDFDVYDKGDNLFIFRETGVMQYTVFFDRYTVNM